MTPNPDELEQSLGYTFRDRALLHRALTHSSKANESLAAETGRGDFLWPRGEALRRRGERDVAPYLYAGLQLISPQIFESAPPPPFSMNLLWDQALAKNRLGAIVHDGVWFHLSTPDDLARAEAVLEARVVGNTT